VAAKNLVQKSAITRLIAINAGGRDTSDANSLGGKAP
jgi:hypothetical protein